MYIFLMDKGKLVNLTEFQPNQPVSQLRLIIERNYEIPVNRQILLLSGGFHLEPGDKLDNGEGCDETNPIYLFTKTNPREQQYETPDRLSVNDNGILARLNHHVVSSPVLPWPQDVMESLTTLYSISADIMNHFKLSIHEQQMMIQGWRIASANLAEVASQTSVRVEEAMSKLRCFESHVLKWEHHFSKYKELRATLQSIPILSALDAAEQQDSRDKPRNLFDLLCRQVFPSAGGPGRRTEAETDRHRQPTCLLNSSPLSSSGARMTGASSLRNLTQIKSLGRRRTTSMRETDDCSGFLPETNDSPASDASSSSLTELCRNVEQARADLFFLRFGIDRSSAQANLTSNSPLASSPPDADDGIKVSLDPDDAASLQNAPVSSKMTFANGQMECMKRTLRNIQDDHASSVAGLDSSQLMESRKMAESGEVGENSEMPASIFESCLLDTSSQSLMQSMKFAEQRNASSFTEHLNFINSDLTESMDLAKSLRYLHDQIKEIALQFKAISDAATKKNMQEQCVGAMKAFLFKFRALAQKLLDCSDQKVKLSEFLYKEQIWMQATQSEINRLDRSIQRCLRKIHAVSTTGTILVKMQFAPEVYTRCLVELVRRREFDQEWHSWLRSVNDDGLLVREEELRARRRFSRITLHPALSDLFTSLTSSKLPRWTSGSARRPQSASAVSDEATRSKSLREGRARSPTEFARISRTSRQQTSEVASSVRFDVSRNAHTVTGVPRELREASRSGCSSQPNLTKLETSAVDASDLKRNNTVSRMSCSVGEEAAGQAPRRGSTGYNMATLSPMPECVSSARDFDFQSDYPAVTREDLLRLSADLPPHLVDILTDHETPASQTGGDDQSGSIFDESLEDDMQTFTVDEDSLSQALKRAGAHCIHQISSRSRSLFSRYRQMRQTGDPDVFSVKHPRRRMGSESSQYSHLSNGATPDLAKDAPLTVQCSSSLDNSATAVPECSSSTVLAEEHEGHRELQCQRSVSFGLMGDEEAGPILPLSSLIKVHTDVGTMTDAAEEPERPDAADMAVATTPVELADQSQQTIHLDDEDTHSHTSSNGTFYEVAEQAQEPNLPASSTLSLDDPHMYASFFSVLNDEAHPEHEPEQDLRRLLSDDRFRSLISSLISAHNRFDQGTPHQSSQLQLIAQQLDSIGVPLKLQAQTRESEVSAIAEPVSVSCKGIATEALPHPVRPKLTMSQMYTTIVRPTQNSSANKGMLQFANRNFQENDVVLFIPIQVKKIGAKSRADNPQLTASTFNPDASNMQASVMNVSGGCEAMVQSLTGVQSNAQRAMVSPGGEDKVIEQWRMLSDDGEVYFLHPDDFHAFEIDDLAKVRVTRGFDSAKRFLRAHKGSRDSDEPSPCRLPHAQRQHSYLAGRFISKERCRTTKPDNRYNVPMDFFFYRVRARPEFPLSEPTDKDSPAEKATEAAANS